MKERNRRGKERHADERKGEVLLRLSRRGDTESREEEMGRVAGRRDERVRGGSRKKLGLKKENK